MALTKEYETTTTVLPDGQLQVRTATLIMEDGVELSKSYHRKVLDVGDDASNEPQIVKDIAAKIHNAARRTARATAKAAQETGQP